MPAQPLQKYTLKEMEQKFTDKDDFYLEDVEGTSEGVMMTWQTRKGFLYQVQFYVNEFSQLKQPAKIHDITAAIDESKFYGMKIVFG